jgi:hypothetical protein
VFAEKANGLFVASPRPKVGFCRVVLGFFGRRHNPQKLNLCAAGFSLQSLTQTLQN